MPHRDLDTSKCEIPDGDKVPLRGGVDGDPSHRFDDGAHRRTLVIDELELTRD
jgi:hypothetical protein